MENEALKRVIESLIFASDRAISVESLAGVVEGVDKKTIRAALAELIEDYNARSSGILIEEVAGGFQYRTSPESAPWLRRLFKIGLQRISKAAMETLAIVAYRQPVTRGEVEAVRGVDSGAVLATLMDKRFIKITGRKEVPGRPVVYGTTKEFLETFDLKDLSCLPSLKDIEKMEEENGAAREGTEAATVEGHESVPSGEPEAGIHGGEGAEAAPAGAEPEAGPGGVPGGEGETAHGTGEAGARGDELPEPEGAGTGKA